MKKTSVKKNRRSKQGSQQKKPHRKILLVTDLSPGDLLMLSAALRDLKRAHPSFLVDVQTNVPAIWENNPNITALDRSDPDVEVINVEYPLIHESNTRPWHFIHGYRLFLEQALGVGIPMGEFQGDVYLSDIEKSWMSQVQEHGIHQNFWILVSGGKYDYTAKWWNPLEFQKVVDHFRDKIVFVQCGEASHHHPPLRNVMNLVGQTDTRQFMRLMYHAAGVVCPVTFAMHLAAAIETKRKMPLKRACVVMAGGREPANWESYPHHRFLSLNGALDCCDDGGCWRSRAFPLGDGDEKDLSLCVYPEEIDYEIMLPSAKQKSKLKIPKCMRMITAKDVIRAIEVHYEGGVLEYDGGWTRAEETLGAVREMKSSVEVTETLSVKEPAIDV
jgi:ADP-heptose:LPS heptosyltransferase